MSMRTVWLNLRFWAVGGVSLVGSSFFSFSGCLFFPWLGDWLGTGEGMGVFTWAVGRTWWVFRWLQLGVVEGCGGL